MHVAINYTPLSMAYYAYDSIAINYTPLSMAYYTYSSTANFLSLGSTVLIYAYQKNGAAKRSYTRGVGNFVFEPVMRKLRQLF